MLSNFRYLRGFAPIKRYSSSDMKFNQRIIYSSLKETVGRGRSFQKMIYHRNLVRENDIRRRKIEMDDNNNVPVALKLAYEGIGVVQGEQEEVETEEFDHPEFLDESVDVLPYAIHDELNHSHDEDLEIELFDPDSDRVKSENLLKEDEMFRFGTPNPTLAPSKVPCGGCGAHIHCQDAKMPGYIPSELFQKGMPGICQRCYILKRYNVALKLNVSPEDYPKTIQHIKNEKNVLIVLVVDMADFPSSIWPGILDLIGADKSVILVGNKIDLLPKDSNNYLHHLEKCMVKEFNRKCSVHGYKFYVIDKVLISAMTGYNVETLIDKIFKNIYNIRGKRDNDKQKLEPNKKIYLVGSTNVGKSSIFNMLLESDLCKVQAYNKVEKASVTPVPGTTLNLLKFPVTRPDPSRMNERLSRLTKDASILSNIEKRRLEELIATKDPKFSTPIGIVGRTFGQDKSSNIMDFSFSGQDKLDDILPKRLNPKHPDFADGRWFYDTPGTVSNDQIINLLTQEELQIILPQHTIQPQTFLIRVGQSIVLGGIAGLDVIQGMDITQYRHPLRITVFCSSALPIHIVETSYVKEFIQEHLYDLKVPSFKQSRLDKLPPMEYKDFVVDSSKEETSVDIVLSSIGWISCFPKRRYIFDVRAWTPGGKGLVARHPAFLPFAYNLKGNRISGTPTYTNQGVFLPK